MKSRLQRRNERTYVQETDDYLEKGHTNPALVPPSPSWVRMFFEPAAIALMISCISWAIGEFVSAINLDAQRSLLIAGPIFGAFTGYRSWIVSQRKLLDGTDRLRRQLTEIAMLFLLIKLASHLDETMPMIASAFTSWLSKPLTFFDSESVITFILSVGAWLVGTITARDLAAIHDPFMYAGETGPMQRLMRRFLIGGIALLFITALGRVRIVEVLTQQNQRVNGMMLNVLVYFVLGFIMLGQLRFARLASLWNKQNVTISSGLKVRWLRYSMILIAGVTVVALFLPTSYALSLMDVIGFIFALIGFLATLLYLLISLPFIWLLSLFSGDEVTPPSPPAELPELIPPEPGASSSSPPWLQVVQSVVFWLIGIALVTYVVRMYIRDHPAFLPNLRNFRVVEWMASIWHKIHQWWSGTLRRLHNGRLRDKVSRQNPSKRRLGTHSRRIGNPAGRNAVISAYYDTLDEAKQQGVARRASQTPYEYEPSLEDAVEKTEAVDALTELFIKAHYSIDEITPADVEASIDHARTIRDELRQRSSLETDNTENPSKS